MGRKNEIEGQLNLFDIWNMEEESAEEIVTEPAETKAVVKKPGDFRECATCWCATCEHSTVGGSVPRPFGDSLLPCPSCELCVKQGHADICVIGSAEEGCSYRAQKEGI